MHQSIHYLQNIPKKISVVNNNQLRTSLAERSVAAFVNNLTTTAATAAVKWNVRKHIFKWRKLSNLAGLFIQYRSPILTVHIQRILVFDIIQKCRDITFYGSYFMSNT